MALIAKRKMHQTWREAVMARALTGAGEAGERCLAMFDRLVGAGAGEAQAAYRALAAYDLLWAEGPSDPGPPSSPELAAQEGDPHRLPNV
jgi:hypothetical protein